MLRSFQNSIIFGIMDVEEIWRSDLGAMGCTRAPACYMG